MDKVVGKELSDTNFTQQRRPSSGGCREQQLIGRIPERQIDKLHDITGYIIGFRGYFSFRI